MTEYERLRRADFERHKRAQEACQALKPIAEHLKALPWSEHRHWALTHFAAWREADDRYEAVLMGKE